MAKITGKKPNISGTMARIAGHGHYFSPEKARTELDLPQTPLKDAVREAYEWFQENGYLE